MSKTFNTRFWKFTEGVQTPSEKWVRPGKVEWPDMVMIKVDRARALDIIESLAHQLRDHNECEMTLPGELTPNDD